ncbi:S8 family peptidase [Microbulbifer sp. SSSA002]|uniref:S8 family peptidase n=1 Tax=unclassified Microbulbifer TaxID=2619833 RepID=UPI0040393D8A
MKSSLKSLLQKTTLASALSLLCATPFAAHAAEADNTLLTDRIIVKYKDSAKVGKAATMATETVEKASRRAGHKMRHLRRMATGAQVMRLEGRKNRSEVNAIIERLKQDPDVEYAEPDLIMQAMAEPNDPSYLNQWHYYESTGGLNLPEAWDVTQGDGVVVAVLDTGYLPHADLIDNILPGYDMISDTFVSVDGDERDDDPTDPGDWYEAGTCDESSESDSSWHGTHVAGTIAGVTNNNMGIAGVAYEAKIVPVRVLGRCGGYTSDIADGIIWGAGGSVSGLPTNENPAQVLNLSLGGSGSCDTTTQSAIDTARGLGATVVVAAGNSGANAGQYSPASCEGVITVAATDRTGGRSYYSNYGSVVDVAAPGGAQSYANDPDGILSTYNNGSTDAGSDSYYYSQGTSMAAPHVAGAAALIYAVDPDVTPDEVESILTSTARSFPSSCNNCGAGIVDAAAAVAMASGDDSSDDSGDDSDSGSDSSWTATNLSGSEGNWDRYSIDIEAGTSSLTVEISGGSGDADLYLRHGSNPNLRRYDCRPYISGNDESCTISNPDSGTWYIGIHAYESYTGVTLEAEVTE